MLNPNRGDRLTLGQNPFEPQIARMPVLAGRFIVPAWGVTPNPDINFGQAVRGLSVGPTSQASTVRVFSPSIPDAVNGALVSARSPYLGFLDAPIRVTAVNPVNSAAAGHLVDVMLWESPPASFPLGRATSRQELLAGAAGIGITNIFPVMGRSNIRVFVNNGAGGGCTLSYLLGFLPNNGAAGLSYATGPTDVMAASTTRMVEVALANGFSSSRCDFLVVGASAGGFGNLTYMAVESDD